MSLDPIYQHIILAYKSIPAIKIKQKLMTLHKDSGILNNLL